MITDARITHVLLVAIGTVKCYACLVPEQKMPRVELPITSST